MSAETLPLLDRDPLIGVWRALADPTRRDILDYLRQSPQTTGDLAERFPLSRYAVMKHLEVLVAAGLVVVRRQGRERWNYLNAIPLQLMYERWVRPYEAMWAGPLTRFKAALEGSPSMEHTPVATKTVGPSVRTANVSQVELEMRIKAPIALVWKALTEDISVWWPNDFYASPNPLRMIFETRLGGRLFEEDHNGGGVVWYTVIGIEQGRSVQLAGHLFPAFGGPSQTLLRLALRDEGAATVLELTDAVFGNTSDRAVASSEAGWRSLFDDAFRTYAETLAQ